MNRSHTFLTAALIALPFLLLPAGVWLTNTTAELWYIEAAFFQPWQGVRWLLRSVTSGGASWACPRPGPIGFIPGRGLRSLKVPAYLSCPSEGLWVSACLLRRLISQRRMTAKSSATAITTAISNMNSRVILSPSSSSPPSDGSGDAVLSVRGAGVNWSEALAVGSGVGVDSAVGVGCGSAVDVGSGAAVGSGVEVGWGAAVVVGCAVGSGAGVG